MNLDHLRRAEFPDMLRDLIAQGCTEISITVDARTALRIADDVDFAVKYGDPNKVKKFVPPIMKGRIGNNGDT